MIYRHRLQSVFVQAAMLSGGHSDRGVTSVKFSPDSQLLISGARRDNRLCVWDLRQLAVPLCASLARNANSNQVCSTRKDAFL